MTCHVVWEQRNKRMNFHVLTYNHVQNKYYEKPTIDSKDGAGKFYDVRTLRMHVFLSFLSIIGNTLQAFCRKPTFVQNLTILKDSEYKQLAERNPWTLKPLKTI